VLIRVHAASVNPLDWKIRAGQMKAVDSTPFIPGCDTREALDTD
jgi:NADPH:quinone reductase-like Zn-dependent oxidoreductase